MQKILPWLATFAVLVVGFGTVYGAVQQSQRSDANMPQIQLAEDTVRAVSAVGKEVAGLNQPVDMKTSLAPFTNVYDAKGNPVAGSGYLDGKLPKIDPGILSSAKGQDYNAVTWEPKADVRIA